MLKTKLLMQVISLLGLAWFFLPVAAQAEERLLNQGFEKCYVDGVPRIGYCQTFDVPLDYTRHDGEMIKLHLALLPASGSNPAPDPIVVLAGGPGQAAGEIAAVAEAVFLKASRKRDILLLDVRGTGRSTPLQCELDDVYEPEEISAAVAECRAGFDFDVGYVNLETITRDLEFVREILGYEQLNLWGVSYGTRKAAHYLKRFEGRVRSVIMDAVLPPQVSLFESVAQSSERAKDKLVEDCMASEYCRARYPDVDQLVDKFLDLAASGDLVFSGPDPVSGEPLTLTITRDMAAESLRGGMYIADGTVILPYVMEQALAGNLNPLMASLSAAGAVGNGMYLGMTFSVLCGEELARTDQSKVTAASIGSYLGDSYYGSFNDNCEAWDYLTVASGGLPSDLYDPVSSDVSALVLSGDLDPITPPEFGEIMLQGLSNGRHIVAPGTGHGISYVGCMPGVIAQFLDDLDPEALDVSCLDHLRRLPVITGANGQVN